MNGWYSKLDIQTDVVTVEKLDGVGPVDNRPSPNTSLTTWSTKKEKKKEEKKLHLKHDTCHVTCDL